MPQPRIRRICGYNPVVKLLLVSRFPWGAPLLLALAACASSPPGATAPSSLTGAPLEAQQIPEGRERWLQLELDAAMAAWEFDPSEMHAVWVGRRLAYLGLYSESISWFRGALATFPDSYRLRRHLGHRLLTIRQLDDAVTVLTVAKALDAPPEPSGARRCARAER